jgi:hypothetical protein
MEGNKNFLAGILLILRRCAEHKFGLPTIKIGTPWEFIDLY